MFWGKNMKRCLHQSQHHGRSLLECSVGWLKGDDGLTKVTTPVRDTAPPLLSKSSRMVADSGKCSQHVNLTAHQRL